MEIAVGLDRGLGLSWDQYRELGRYAARLGYQSVWTNAGVDRDVMHICAQWSVASADVVPGGIGTGVSVIPVGYWSVPALASCAATVGEISGGRFVLGVTDTGLGFAGQPIGALCAFLARETAMPMRGA
jgi:alkanesulfonate monooxygenase SsuD/methylene tetrahydromethanopterin reductase-like flavin-dependent oxidoreductase (luciferase family)